MKILTLNLCTKFPGHSAKERLDKVAAFALGADVDVLLLQEGLRVCTVYDRLRYLARNIDYDWCYKGYIGVPWFYVWQVGIISRFPIVNVESAYLEIPQTEWLDNLPFPGRRRAVTAITRVPDVGTVAFCTVHLNAFPQTEADRQHQFQLLADHLSKVEADAIILGGDFNAGMSSPAFTLLRPLGFNVPFGSSPDYVIADKGRLSNLRMCLTEGVTDHLGGVLVEWTNE